MPLICHTNSMSAPKTLIFNILRVITYSFTTIIIQQKFLKVILRIPTFFTTINCKLRHHYKLNSKCHCMTFPFLTHIPLLASLSHFYVFQLIATHTYILILVSFCFCTVLLDWVEIPKQRQLIFKVIQTSLTDTVYTCSSALALCNASWAHPLAHWHVRVSYFKGPNLCACVRRWTFQSNICKQLKGRWSD